MHFHSDKHSWVVENTPPVKLWLKGYNIVRTIPNLVKPRPVVSDQTKNILVRSVVISVFADSIPGQADLKRSFLKEDLIVLQFHASHILTNANAIYSLLCHV